MSKISFLHLTDLHLSIFEDYENAIQRLDGHANPRQLLGSVMQGAADFLSPHSPRTTYPTSYSSARANSCWDYLTRLTTDKTYDFIIFTGDIANTGEKPDMEAAVKFFEGRRQTNNSGTPLADLSCPAMFLPGNHDRYVGHLNGPGSELFESYFGTNWDMGRHDFSGTLKGAYGGGQGVRTFIADTTPRKTFIVCADFSLKSSTETPLLKRMGQGEVYEDRLKGLVDSTNIARALDDSCIVLWAMHYPPQFPGITDRLRLIEDETVLSRAAKMKVPLIVCGHTHQPHFYSISGYDDVSILCGGSAFGLDDEVGQHFMEVTIDYGEGTDEVTSPNIECNLHSYDLEWSDWGRTKRMSVSPGRNDDLM